MSILMLCQVMEGGRKKCEQYWPAKPGDKVFNELRINTKFVNLIDYCVEMIISSWVY